MANKNVTQPDSKENPDNQTITFTKHDFKRLSFNLDAVSSFYDILHRSGDSFDASEIACVLAPAVHELERFREDIERRLEGKAPISHGRRITDGGAQ